jgi:hypothetical protein
MKNAFILSALGAIAVVSLLASGAFGIEAFKKEFDNKYVKKDPASDTEKAFAIAANKAKCAVCHVGKTKKVRNEYGKALDELLDRKTDAKNTAKIQDALEKVAGMKSNSKDASSPTFGELIEQGKLPGGEVTATTGAE